MPPNLCIVVAFSLAISILASGGGAIGVNWGTQASHPLPPAKVVELLTANNIAKVKLFDADPLVLQALSGSRIEVTVGIPNALLKSLNSSKKVAESWVHDNVTRYFSAGGAGVRIEYIAVGNDPFQQIYSKQFYPYVVGAAANIHAALTSAALDRRVKVVVPCSFDVFESESGHPSTGHFRPDLNKTMVQLLTFLSKNGSPFFVTISPFINLNLSKNISLDFYLFKETAHPLNDSHKTYRNMFELSYDMAAASLSAAGFASMDIVVGQIGWPTDGAAHANSSNAETFTKGLLNHLRSKSGTPLRPHDPPLETYILGLLDEDGRDISDGSFERHWGVFTFDGQAKYHVDFGVGSKSLTNAQNVDYLPSKWCVVNNNEALWNASSVALEACTAADCTSLSPGGSCSNMSWPGKISYAFNSYYQQHDQRADSCVFGGLGLITTVDPSTSNCMFAVQIRTSQSTALRPTFLLRWMTWASTGILHRLVMSDM